MTLFMKMFPLRTHRHLVIHILNSAMTIGRDNRADVSTGEAVATSTTYVRLMK